MRTEDGSQRSFYIETYGCQMNIAESHVLDAEFLRHGFRAAVHPEEADIVILNTCSVRKTAENRVWGRLGYYKHLKASRDLTLIVTGCMAERLKDDLKRQQPAVDLVVGTNDKTDILQFLNAGESSEHNEYSFAHSYYKEGEVSSFVPIMNGCNNFCAYCIVPYVRGRETSRPYEEILSEIDTLKQKGVKEVTLLGQNVNSYEFREEGGIVRFPQLLRMITQRTASSVWIRFLSSHPKDLSPELIDCIAEEPAVCSHLHLPLQSGSTKVLQAMNRKYTAEKYLDLVQSLRARIPDVTFTTDVMVGFPGETPSDHQKTLDVMREAAFIDAYMYYFNPREGTKAASMDGQLEDSVKLSRLQEVIDLQKQLSAEHKNAMIGSTVPVLCDTLSKRDQLQYVGHTEHGERIVFDKSETVQVGEIVDVTISEVVGNTYKGEVRCPGKP
ncbi:MAG: tRNA (N6-isopentenyl adenosine(37)-C2)-methylthiotransferase MiaB [Spirochaetota bacterium]